MGVGWRGAKMGLAGAGVKSCTQNHIVARHVARET